MATGTAKLVLPEPLDNQAPILDAGHARKVVRAGRRFSKTRLAFIAAVAGHGPGWYEGAPLFKGILAGRDVVWVSSDYPNLSTVVWNELIVPTFEPLGAFASLNKNDHTVSLAGLGTLYLRPETAIGGIRGIGERLGGVILDEAAHWDLGGALRQVILPALLDNRGWLMALSTTNRGWDGNADRQLPSYFNRLCAEIRAGQRSDEWKEWTGTAYDNPVLDPAAIDELVAEYDPESAEYKEEVLAELLTGGIGLALPHLSTDQIIPPIPLDMNYLTFGSFDWGYNHPFSFGRWVADTDGNLFRTHTITARHQTPDAIADTVARGLHDVGGVQALRYIVAGPDIKNVDKAKGMQGASVAEQLGQHGWKLTYAENTGPKPRKQRLDNFRRYCGWPATEHTQAEPPRLYLFDNAPNRQAFATWAGMLLDPNDPESPLKVDADHRGRGGDDAYDEASYALASRPITVLTKAKIVFAQDRSPGYDYAKHQVRKRPSAEEEVATMIQRAQPNPIAGRHFVPRR